MVQGGGTANKEGQAIVDIVMLETRLGGPQRRALNIARPLRKRGFIVRIAAASPLNDGLLLACKAGDIPLVKLAIEKPRRTVPGLVRMAYCILSDMEWGRRQAENCGFRHIYHINGWWGIQPFLAAKRSGALTVLHLNDTMAGRLPVLLSRWMAQRADAVIFAGFRARQHVYGESIPDSIAQKAHIIQAPVNTKVFRPHRESKPRQLFRVVTVANINPLKDLETLIRAAAELQSRDINVMMLEVGAELSTQKNYTNRVKGLAYRLGVDNLEFLGPRDDVCSVLQQADTYLCTSRSEASPLAVWEAMACGLPVVSTDVGDVRHFVEKGRCGLVASVADYIALADHIEYLVNHPEEAKAMGKRARQVAVEKLSLERCVDAHERVYREVMSVTKPNWDGQPPFPQRRFE